MHMVYTTKERLYEAGLRRKQGKGKCTEVHAGDSVLSGAIQKARWGVYVNWARSRATIGGLCTTWKQGR